MYTYTHRVSWELGSGGDSDLVELGHTAVPVRDCAHGEGDGERVLGCAGQLSSARVRRGGLTVEQFTAVHLSRLELDGDDVAQRLVQHCRLSVGLEDGGETDAWWARRC